MIRYLCSLAPDSQPGAVGQLLQVDEAYAAACEFVRRCYPFPEHPSGPVVIRVAVRLYPHGAAQLFDVWQETGATYTSKRVDS